MLRMISVTATALFAFFFALLARAEQPWTFANNTRYLAVGDSLSAGVGAIPATRGFPYLLYEQGVYDSMSNTRFANAAIPGATSQQVLSYQVPLATQTPFRPQVITMTVGGNDLLTILNGASFQGALQTFQVNLNLILAQLCTQLPGTRIYVGNLYSIQNFPVPTDQVVNAFNQVLAGVVGSVNAIQMCAGRIRVADIHAAFSGSQVGLLLINRNGAGQFEVHPSNAGHRAIAQAFVAAQ
ncbi:MAG: hypothetical protein NFCOHLIN_01916 [Gammaproteobacteria bacterium]|nr:hypothetical protein [Gammaproteobacteria bacterium]